MYQASAKRNLKNFHVKISSVFRVFLLLYYISYSTHIVRIIFFKSSHHTQPPWFLSQMQLFPLVLKEKFSNQHFLHLTWIIFSISDSFCGRFCFLKEQIPPLSGVFSWSMKLTLASSVWTYQILLHGWDITDLVLLSFWDSASGGGNEGRTKEID